MLAFVWTLFFALAADAALPEPAGERRVLVVFFSDCTKRDLFERLWAKASTGARERDLVIVRADAAVRATFGISSEANAVLLVGKDGTEKRRWRDPPPPGEVFALIDAMPMRQLEIHEGR